MGKRKKSNSAGNESETADASPSDTTEVRIDEEKVKIDSQRSARSVEVIKKIGETVNLMDKIIIELKEIHENWKKINSDSFDKQNVNEANKEGKKGQDIEKSSNDIQNSHSDKEKMTVKKENKDKEDKDKPFEKTKTSPVDFRYGMKNFMTQQNSKLDEQVKNNIDNVSEREEKRDRIPSKKSSTTCESYEETRVKTCLEDKAIKDVSAAKLDDESNERFKQLKNNNGVYFEFESNNNTLMIASANFQCRKEFFLEENQSIVFDFKDEYIQVSFVGNRILVSTQREFNISVQNTNPMTSVDEATQADNPLP